MIKLPHELKDFENEDYWKNFFISLGDKKFEWYLNYTDFDHLLCRYIRKDSNILVVGCGNSDLSYQLSEHIPSCNITSIDIVEDVIIKCEKLYKRKGLKFINMDVCKMDFPDDHFDVVIDKGTLDALAHDSSPHTFNHIQNMWNEILRVIVKPEMSESGDNDCGQYITVSLAQKQILDMIAAHFFDKSTFNGFYKTSTNLQNSCYISSFRVYCLEKVDEIFPIFIFVFSFSSKCTAALKNKTDIFQLTRFEAFDEYLKSNDAGKTPDANGSEPKEKMSVKFESFEKLLDWIKYKQSVYTMTKKGKFEKMSKELNKDDRKNSDQELHFDLFAHGDDRYPRYTFYLVKCPEENYISDGHHKFAAFIVPLGKENEWLFNTTKGRVTLVKSTGYRRVVIVQLNRNHDYPGGMISIQSEISPNINEYRSDDLDLHENIPFLSIGLDGLERKIIERGMTELIDDSISNNLPAASSFEEEGGGGGGGRKIKIEYQVEDVKLGCPDDPNQVWYRRLYLLNTPSLIQSEIELKFDGKAQVSDIDCPLSFEHYKAMVTIAGQYLVTSTEQNLKMLIVGLGGGILPYFMAKHLPNLILEVCEIDAKIADVAHRLFSFPTTPYKGISGSSMHLKVCDGLDYLRELALKPDELDPYKKANKFDAIILDANSFGASDGLYSPPMEFLYPLNMKTLREALTENGFIMTTVLTRDADEKAMVEESFKTHFPSSSFTGREINLGPEDLNKVYLIKPKIMDTNNTDGISNADTYRLLTSRLKQSILSRKNNESTDNFDILDYLIPQESIAHSRIIY